jgi:hypothetical protein
MRIMKRLNIFFVVLACFMLNSCTDLDVSPENGLPSNLAFTSADAYRSYLAKVYASFSLTGQDGPSGDTDITIVNDEGFTSYIRAYWKAQELTTDEAVCGSENQFVKVLYYRISLIVSLSNDFLQLSSDETMDLHGVPEADRDEIRAYRNDARFLRALAYWHALDLFRNVVLAEEVSVGFPEQSSPEDMFAFIKSELEAVESELPAPRQGDYGRVDQAGVWMLQAKLYLNAEAMIGQDYYTECLAACEKVIAAGYTLEPNYEELFMKDNHLSNEIIFPLISDGTRVQSWGCTTFLVQAAIGGSMSDSDSGVAGGWAGLRTTRNLIEQFPDVTGDIDSRAIFYTDGQALDITDIGEFTEGIAVPKYKNLNAAGDVGSNNTHVDTDYPMFRLADAYLMYVEATLRGASGDLALATDYINALRLRAYGDDSGNVSQADLDLGFILNERSRELYWEGTRRIDLVRFGLFTSGDYLWPWKGNVQEGRGVESFRDIFPIPSSDMIANPNLVQNPGY